MHKRKGVLVNSPALVSLKLCIFFRLFSSFFVLLYPFSAFFTFSALFILFIFFSAFLTLPCLLLSFYILFHLLLLFPILPLIFRSVTFLLYPFFTAFYFLGLFIISFISLYFLLPFILDLIPLLSLYPCSSLLCLCVFPFIFPWSLCSYSFLCVPFVVI